jgi:hypothetical protein
LETFRLEDLLDLWLGREFQSCLVHGTFRFAQSGHPKLQYQRAKETDVDRGGIFRVIRRIQEIYQDSEKADDICQGRIGHEKDILERYAVENGGILWVGLYWAIDTWGFGLAKCRESDRISANVTLD